MKSAVLQVPAHREPALSGTLDALADQRAPAGWTLGYECWVTPAAGVADRRDCGTWRQAADHPIFEAFEAPRGKLSARNAAHDAALDDGADAVVTWDADTTPQNSRSLAALVEPLADDDVVATNSRPYAPPSPLSLVTNAVAVVRRTLTPHLHGQASGISAEGWRAAGPFDTDLDQTDIGDVWAEEEVGFYWRLQSVGRVARPPAAVVWSSNRRAHCKIERAMTMGVRPVTSGWCRRRGVESFAGSKPVMGLSVRKKEPAAERRR